MRATSPDRKSTRLNSSHTVISYAVFCLTQKVKMAEIEIQRTLIYSLMHVNGIMVNRAKKNGMGNITSSVNSRERRGINTILHELNPLFTINVTMMDIKSKNVYSRVNSKATTQWRNFVNDNAVTDIYALSLHHAICIFFKEPTPARHSPIFLTGRLPI